MYIKVVTFIIALSLLAISPVTIASEPTQKPANPALTSHEKLTALINNYQKICLSEECHSQLIQIRKFGRWGDAKSQLVVASAYLYGDGFEQDTQNAISWFKRVAYNHSPGAAKYSLSAFHTMAKLYQAGIGVEQDIALAKKYFDKLAGKQYGPVLFDRAFVEFEQDNLTQGIKLLEQASNGNHAEASYFLARIYQQGEFVERDIKKSANYYQGIVRQDYKDSRQRLEQLISEMESSTSTLSQATASQQQDFISKLNASLDIEVITVSYHAMSFKEAMTSQLTRLNKYKAQFTPATGSRIKGKTCGSTSYPCRLSNAEDIEDARNENPLPAF